MKSDLPDAQQLCWAVRASSPAASFACIVVTLFSFVGDGSLKIKMNLYAKKHARNSSSIQFNRIMMMQNQEMQQENIEQNDQNKQSQLNCPYQLIDQQIGFNENINLQQFISNNNNINNNPAKYNNPINSNAYTKIQINRDSLSSLSSFANGNSIAASNIPASNIAPSNGSTSNNNTLNVNVEVKKNLLKNDNANIVSTRANTTITNMTQESFGSTNKENTPP